MLSFDVQQAAKHAGLCGPLAIFVVVGKPLRPFIRGTSLLVTMVHVFQCMHTE
jgi:hypothetical protein